MATFKPTTSRQRPASTVRTVRLAWLVENDYESGMVCLEVKNRVQRLDPDRAQQLGLALLNAVERAKRGVS